jgi:N-acetylmuramoyl-L-alanine amidase
MRITAALIRELWEPIRFRLEEKQVTLAVSLRFRDELKSQGHTVVMTRTQDKGLELGTRARIANDARTDFFVSVHAKAADAPSAQGMEVYHFPASTSGGVGAEKVLTEMLARFPGHRNRSVKEANFAVLRLTNMPAILVETEFVTNPTQLRFLADTANQVGLAEAIARGVQQWIDD